MMPGVVAVHQPEFLPWLGFCDKAAAADTLVLLDTVQFRKRYFQNRNRIRTADGCGWLTIPVRHPQRVPIAALRIDRDSPFLKKNPRTLERAYRCAPYFDRYFPPLRDILAATWDTLIDLNEALIRFIFDALEIGTALVRASKCSAFDGDGPSGLLLDLCVQAGASVYLSGVSGREYLDLRLFERAGLDVRFQEFHHPVYQQLHDPFMPCMSAVDLLFNHGPASSAILTGEGVERLETVFE
jgi:hypothetical protein